MTKTQHPAPQQDQNACANGERPVNPWRCPKTAKADDLVSQVSQLVTATEQRKRKRKTKDQEVHDACLAALISDVVYNTITGTHSDLYVSLSHRTLMGRYATPLSTRTLSHLLKHLTDPNVQLLRMSKGVQNKDGPNRATTVSAGPALLQLIADTGVTADDFQLLPLQEPIILKAPKPGHFDKAEEIDYVETAETSGMRDAMLAINTALRSHSFTYKGPGHVDLNDRDLKRIFTCGGFDNGGRLYGGFWQPMGKHSRLRYLRVNGEDLVELDYGQVMPRLLYTAAGNTPPKGDLYRIPGFELCRPGVKRMMSSMAFIQGRMTRFPKGVGKLFPKGVKAKDVTDAIEAAHPEIAHLFYTGIGHQCQNHESNILVTVLQTLNGHGIPALPVHDAILVPRSSVDEAEAAMLDAFADYTGAPADLDTLYPEDLDLVAA